MTCPIVDSINRLYEIRGGRDIVSTNITFVGGTEIMCEYVDYDLSVRTLSVARLKLNMASRNECLRARDRIFADVGDTTYSAFAYLSAAIMRENRVMESFAELYGNIETLEIAIVQYCSVRGVKNAVVKSIDWVALDPPQALATPRSLARVLDVICEYINKIRIDTIAAEPIEDANLPIFGELTLASKSLVSDLASDASLASTRTSEDCIRAMEELLQVLEPVYAHARAMEKYVSHATAYLHKCGHHIRALTCKLVAAISK